MLERAERRLAEHLGAVARVVVKRAAMKARDERELYLLLADEIEDKEEKKAFIRRAISTSGKPLPSRLTPARRWLAFKRSFEFSPGVPMSLRAVKPPHETRTRILDAAEELFMQHGFEGTSMRLLTAKAGVNLAAVNYHFGSKDALIEAVFRRRLDPMNTARIAALEQARGRRGRPLAPRPSSAPSSARACA